MTLAQKVVIARKQKGITQEELALAANLTVRTIQRIESGETTPRPFTLKALATGLGLSFEELSTTAPDEAEKIDSPIAAVPALHNEEEENRDFLQLLCLSCFCYLVLPFIHFLVPLYFLRKRKVRPSAVKVFARVIIRTQIYWAIALHLLLLLTLMYNIICVAYGHRSFTIHYLVPFFGMYFINAGIIIYTFSQTKRLDYATPATA